MDNESKKVKELKMEERPRGWQNQLIAENKICVNLREKARTKGFIRSV